VGYADVRRPDDRLAAIIDECLGDAHTVVNIGAGAGSYEPDNRPVVALEPSRLMLTQHPGSRRVQGFAEVIPFADASFDAAMAILTVHHWRDLHVGISEMKRVAKRQVVFTWDPDHDRELWRHAPALWLASRCVERCYFDGFLRSSIGSSRRRVAIRSTALSVRFRSPRSRPPT
jgi:ubiquinone/menaquinone biosynthesis C-methylase UbiE